MFDNYQITDNSHPVTDEKWGVFEETPTGERLVKGGFNTEEDAMDYAIDNGDTFFQMSYFPEDYAS